MNKGLVSIVTPCYNSAAYIDRYIESIINQDYRQIQLILVNDGSIDETEKKISKYKSSFEEKGMGLVYIYQENQGQAAAINNGLKYVKGEYLIWPDSDDFLFTNSVSTRVNFLNQNKEFGLVMSNGHLYDENDIFIPVKELSTNESVVSLYDKIVDLSAVFNPNGYMVRFQNFIDSNNGLDIFVSRGGQNIQMLMPISRNCECGYIDTPLYGKVERLQSHSKQAKNLGSQLDRIDIITKIQINVLLKLDEFIVSDMIKVLTVNIYSKFCTSLYYGKKDLQRKYFLLLKNMTINNIKRLFVSIIKQMMITKRGKKNENYRT